MDSEIIKNSLGQLESELETAREAANRLPTRSNKTTSMKQYQREPLRAPKLRIP